MGHFAICILILLNIVTAIDNQFIFPPNLALGSVVVGSFPVGSVFVIRWHTVFEKIDLVIWQIGAASEFQYLPNSVGISNKSQSFTWTVDVSGTGGNPKFDLSLSPSFFFGFFESGATSAYESQYVNFTNNAVSPLSIGFSSSTIGTTSSTSSTTATVSTTLTPAASTASTSSVLSTTANSATAPSTIPSSMTSPNSSGGMSTAAKTGLGVGVGIGVLALVAGFGIGYWFYGRKKSAAAQSRVYMDGAPPYASQPNRMSEIVQQQVLKPQLLRSELHS